MRNFLCFLAFILLQTSLFAAKTYDVVIYGGNSAAVTAAVQAKKMGKNVVIVSPDTHLGGLSSGGLGFTDSGNTGSVGGLSREFYHRVYQEYQKDKTWKWQKKDDYSNVGQGTKAMLHDDQTMWIFEPHVAEIVFDSWVDEMKIPVFRDHRIDRENGVVKKNGRIESITTLNGETFNGTMFIDATYEGDLLAAAGVSYMIGREPNALFGEKWNGNQVGVLHHNHFFAPGKVDPYKIPGDPASGLLPYIDNDPPGVKGEGDKRLQAYCFRMCLTNNPENRVPFIKPENYDPANYELLKRVFEYGWRDSFGKFDPIPNKKTDTNNCGPFSTDFIGMNYDYPEASYEKRAEIIKAHRDYQQGLLYFVANDPSVPDDIRKKMSQWGLAKDEFTDNGNWPHQIYVREARRLNGEYVTTEHDCLGTKPTSPAPPAYLANKPRGSIGMGSYTLDSHNVRRYVTPEGHVQNEGDIGVHPRGPYKIDFGSILPKKAECENLVVPAAVSSTHIAYGSIRMEPVFMILAQSAATAACMAIDAKTAVQDVPYSDLADRLIADGQRLEHKRDLNQGSGIPLKEVEGIVIDESQAKLEGNWTHSTTTPGYIGDGYSHDGNENKGNCSATYEFQLEKAGVYEVRMAYTPLGNRASNVPVEIHTKNGIVKKIVNQRDKPTLPHSMISLGSAEFGKTATIVVSNQDTDGHVIIDAISLVSRMKP
ncbi:MAG: FAD-dependent oxidoreductase [Thermoguttaceae bacterium]